MDFPRNINVTETLPSWIIPVDSIRIGLDLFTLIVALLLLSIIVFNKLYTTVPMVLVINSCFAELLFGICTFAMDTLALYNDINNIYSYNWFCILLGYLSYAADGIQNYSYLLQAIYRYILIVYPAKLSYQAMKFQISIIIITGICCMIYPLILLLTGQIEYLPYDQICQMPFRFSSITIINAVYIYYIPMPGIIIIYLKMVRYVQEMNKHVTPANQLSRAKRELTMVKRILSLVFLLVCLGFPYAVFICISFFTEPPKYSFRIAYSFISVSLALVLIALFQITEPLKASVLNRIRTRDVNVIQPIE